MNDFFRDKQGNPLYLVGLQAHNSSTGTDMLDKAIFLMRKEKVQVGLKAVVTEANRKWTSLALHDEIRKEHEIMSRREAERKR